METIDKTLDSIASIVKDGNDVPEKVILEIIIDKINEITEWINTQ